MAKAKSSLHGLYRRRLEKFYSFKRNGFDYRLVQLQFGSWRRPNEIEKFRRR